jgi:hypothetical protein
MAELSVYVTSAFQVNRTYINFNLNKEVSRSIIRPILYYIKSLNAVLLQEIANNLVQFSHGPV